MPIPLLGLCDTNSIYSRTFSSDGYGGGSTVSTLVVTAWKCRKTIPRGEENLTNLIQGKDSENQWVFIGEPNTIITEGMYITESDGTNYEILKLVKQRDALGNVHHYKIYAEKV